MCGSCGTFDLAGSTPWCHPRVAAASASLRHRDPDHEDHCTDAGIARGFRRLADTDLRCRPRPMSESVELLPAMVDRGGG